MHRCKPVHFLFHVKHNTAPRTVIARRAMPDVAMTRNFVNFV